VCIFYFFIGAALAELASAVPSSASGMIASEEDDGLCNIWLTYLTSLSLGVGDGRAKIRAHLQLVSRLVCWTDLTIVSGSV
jgi:hypothetical protein